MAVYQTVYLVDTHISLAATALLDRWVRRGGCLFGTVGAGSRDEIDRPNADASALFGLERPKSGAVLLADANPITSTKRDLPYATPLDAVLTSLGSASVIRMGSGKPEGQEALPAFGLIERLEVLAKDVEVLAAFNSTAGPALTVRKVGMGHAVSPSPPGPSTHSCTHAIVPWNSEHQ
jgi:hypothetical protein